MYIKEARAGDIVGEGLIGCKFVELTLSDGTSWKYYHCHPQLLDTVKLLAEKQVQVHLDDMGNLLISIFDADLCRQSSD